MPKDLSTVFASVFDALSVGAFVISRQSSNEFTLEALNHASLQIAQWQGLDKEALAGRPMQEVFEGIEESGLLDQYNLALDSRKTIYLGPLEYEDPLVPLATFDVNLIPLEPDLLLATFTNITDRKKAEESLKSSEAHFRAMAENSPDHIMVLDLDGTIRYINRAVPDLTIDEVITTSVYDYVPERHHQKMRTCFQRVLASGKPDDYVLEYVSKDGAISLFETNVGPVFNDDNVTSYITYSRDITKHREAEMKMSSLSLQLMEAQEDERRRIAQELHDEVGGLLASLQIGLELIPPEMRKTVPEFANLSTLVDSLQEEVRSVTLALRPNTLDHLGLQAAIHLFADRFTNQTKINVELVYEIEPDARYPQEIETAAYRLVQEALTNVARHADTHHASVRLCSTEKELVVDVRDLGVGFDLEESDVRDSLGISGMRHRAAVLGGIVAVESQPGSGTLITARFPL